MGQNIRGWRPGHEYFTHEWSDLAYLYLQCKLQPQKYYPTKCLNELLNNELLNHEYFVPRKLPAIRYIEHTGHSQVLSLTIDKRRSGARYHLILVLYTEASKTISYLLPGNLLEIIIMFPRDIISSAIYNTPCVVLANDWPHPVETLQSRYFIAITCKRAG